MSNQTPPLITEEQFNQQVSGWTVTTKGRMAGNAPDKSGKLKQSVSHALKLEFGAVSRVRFNFERYGVFVHYGVGRGYIRQGGAVVRGFVTKAKGSKPVRTEAGEGGLNRHPVDWFDVEIRQGLTQLADISQEFYGDLAMRKILANMDKFLIQKK